MEYALTARAVENEVWELQHPDGQAKKPGSQTFVFNHDDDDD